MSPNSNEVLEVLSKRWELVEHLLADPQDRCDLHEKVVPSRSTVYRGLEQLRECELARESNGTYEVTELGRALAREYDQFMERIENIMAVGGSLTNVIDETVLHPQLLDGARITVAKRTEPNAPADEVAEILQGADEVAGFTPVLDRHLLVATERNVRDGEFRASLVVEREMLDQLGSRPAPVFEFLSDADGVSLYATEQSLPFGLLDVGEPCPEICLSFYGPIGELRGVIRNDTERSREWATRTYRTYREEAARYPATGRA